MSNPFYKNPSFKISEIFETLGINFKNDTLDKEVTDIKDLLNANNNEITFLHSKNIHTLQKTKASFTTTNLLKNYLPELRSIIVENVLVEFKGHFKILSDL